MLAFEKYNSIENSSRQKTINMIVESGLSNKEWVVTEKIHGSNSSFYISNEGVRCAKRSGFVEENEKFYNIHQVRESYMPHFRVLMEYCVELFSSTDIILCGEVFGGSYPHNDIPRVNDAIRVQKGVHYAPFNDFYAFDLKVNGVYVNYNIFEEIMEDIGFIYAKPLLKGTLEECLQYSNEFQTTIPSTWYKLPDIEDNVCEGVVIKPISTECFPNGSRVILKNKNSKFSEKEKKTPIVKQEVKLDDERSIRISESSIEYVTENRLRNVLSHIGEVTDKDFGKILGLFSKDIIDDLSKDFEEDIDLIEKEDFKYIKKNIQNQCKELIRDNFVNIIDNNF